MEADHLTMCKFTGPEDPNFELVAGKPRQMATKARADTSANRAVNPQNVDTGAAAESEHHEREPQLLLPASSSSTDAPEYTIGQEVIYRIGQEPENFRIADVQNEGRRNEEYQLIGANDTLFLNGRWVRSHELVPHLSTSNLA
jgi:hypothetical protein